MVRKSHCKVLFAPLKMSIEFDKTKKPTANQNAGFFSLYLHFADSQLEKHGWSCRHSWKDHWAYCRQRKAGSIQVTKKFVN